MFEILIIYYKIKKGGRLLILSLSETIVRIDKKHSKFNERCFPSNMINYV